MPAIPARLRGLVVRRAAGRCEYCSLSQVGQEATFHIDHIIPVTAAGETTSRNLALACVSCSLRKGARTIATDPSDGIVVALYHPRRNRWAEHFHWDEEFLVGITPTGRATVEALDLNRALILAIRQVEAALGRHPPPDDWPKVRGKR